MPPNPDDDGLRRRDDMLMAELDKRLALVEQAQNLEHKAAEARWRSLENAVAALNTDVKTALGTLQAAMAEPVQTPAGRALLAAIETLARDGKQHGDDIESLQNFQTEIRSAMKFLRGLVTVSAGVSGLAAAAQLLHLHFGP